MGRRRRSPAPQAVPVAPPALVAVPDKLLRPTLADFPGGAAEALEARQVWLAANPYHDHFAEVRGWEVQDLRYLGSRS